MIPPVEDHLISCVLLMIKCVMMYVVLSTMNGYDMCTSMGEALSICTSVNIE